MAGAQIYRTWKFGLKPAVFGGFTNAIASSPIVLESCSTLKIWQVF